MTNDWKKVESQKKILEGPLKLGTYRNKRHGTFYKVTHFEIHSETLEPMVSYINGHGEHWTRPYDLFVEKFERVDA